MFSRFFGKRDKSDSTPSPASEPSQAFGVAHGGQPAGQLPQGNSGPPAAPRSAAAPVVPVLPTAAPAKPVAPAPAPAPASVQVPSGTADTPDEMTPEERKNAALAVVELHHLRIGNTIRTLWGYKECSVYINKLIMAGGDGMGHARVGFNQDAVEAMLTLSDLHDTEFGPPDNPPGALGL